MGQILCRLKRAKKGDDARFAAANALFERGKYAAAAAIFRRMTLEHAAARGKADAHTLWSAHLLQRALHELGAYDEAEDVGRDLLRLHDEFGDGDGALGPRHSLARTLHAREKYAEAEALGWEVVAECERAVGPEDVETLYCKGWLAQLLGEQKKWREAERVSREAVEGLERVLGKRHKDTRWNREMHAYLSSRLSASGGDSKDAATERGGGGDDDDDASGGDCIHSLEEPPPPYEAQCSPGPGELGQVGVVLDSTTPKP